MLSSSLLRDAIVAAAAAVAMAAGFPKLGAAWLVPVGTAALFWVWQDASWKRAALLGWFAGTIFFAIDFSWIGHTVSSYIGPFGPFLMFGPGLYEAWFFAIAGVLAVAAYRRVAPPLAPLAAAAPFAIMEWLRSIGVLAVPFDQLGYTQADSPLKAIAAFGGTYGITFVLCVLGAYAADALHRRTWRPLAIAVAAVALATGLAWLAWPARSLPPATIPVAAIQGNIAQSLKWNNLDLAVKRYTALTDRAAAHHPKLIVWPETVITTVLNERPDLLQNFLSLSHDANATIVAGTQQVRHDAFYNVLYFLNPDGRYAIYAKRQLVPYAEWFPGQAYLSWLPYIGRLNGGITPATIDGVYPTTALRVAPLICWESAFADLAYAQVRKGAQLFVVSTDDAWFGSTSGPYMHAQISQLRAIETGRYVVRAAATGISGIIAPDGTWRARSALERIEVVEGTVGPPVTTFFSIAGPTAIGAGLVALYAILLAVPRRREGSAAR